jgi:hypothetical protein
MKRPTTGTLVLLTGVGDMLFVPVLFREQLADIGSARVLGTVMFGERASPKGAALWFASKGALLIGLGQFARAHHRLTGTLPAAPGWVLIALGATGGIMAPTSGFWLYVVLGSLWVSDSRLKRSDHRHKRPRQATNRVSYVSPSQ